jgi:DNA-binding NarL/FixJ family response regulator
MSTPLDRSEPAVETNGASYCGTIAHTPESATDALVGLSADPQVRLAVVIHNSQLYCDCLTRSIRGAIGDQVVSFACVEAWLQSPHRSVALVLICMSGMPKDVQAQQLDVVLSRRENAPPVVVLGDSEEPEYVFDVLAKGARGYIPTSLSLDITVQALRLVRAGGVFLPANSLLTSQRMSGEFTTASRTNLGMFTAKQAAVIEAIRKGKANKTIAYELSMCESTVKVHVRNIMKKLKARNRTQVAFIASQMLKDNVG